MERSDTVGSWAVIAYLSENWSIYIIKRVQNERVRSVGLLKFFIISCSLG